MAVDVFGNLIKTLGGVEAQQLAAKDRFDRLAQQEIANARANRQDASTNALRQQQIAASQTAQELSADKLLTARNARLIDAGSYIPNASLVNVSAPTVTQQTKAKSDALAKIEAQYKGLVAPTKPVALSGEEGRSAFYKTDIGKQYAPIPDQPGIVGGIAQYTRPTPKVSEPDALRKFVGEDFQGKVNKYTEAKNTYQDSIAKRDIALAQARDADYTKIVKGKEKLKTTAEYAEGLTEDIKANDTYYATLPERLKAKYIKEQLKSPLSAFRKAKADKVADTKEIAKSKKKAELELSKQLKVEGAKQLNKIELQKLIGNIKARATTDKDKAKLEQIRLKALLDDN